MKAHTGFTLVELVVVVLILGILAAVAAPKLLNTSSAATDNGLRQTLLVVRDAIDHYSADHGGDLPPTTSAAGFRNALVPYLRDGFPNCPVGPGASNPSQAIDVKFGTATGFDPPPTKAWYFNTNTGHFFVNFGGATISDPTVSYDEL